MKKLFSTALPALLSITALGQIHMKEIDETIVKINDGLYA